MCLCIIGYPSNLDSYLDAYNMIRSITGIGKGPFVTFHDGFQGFPTWAGFLPGCDRCAMDQHNYLGFTTPSNDSTGYNAAKPCAYWAMNYNVSMQAYGLSLSGEWSQAINDCGVYLNNVGNGARYDGTYIAPGQTVRAAQKITCSPDAWCCMSSDRTIVSPCPQRIATDTDLPGCWQLRLLE